MTVDQLAPGGRGQLGIAATGSGLWLGWSVDMLARGLVLAGWTGWSMDLLARTGCLWTDRLARGLTGMSG